MIAMTTAEIAGVVGLGILVVLSIGGTAALHAIRNFGVAWLGDPDPQTSWVLEPATAVFTAGVTFLAAKKLRMKAPAAPSKVPI